MLTSIDEKHNAISPRIAAHRRESIRAQALSLVYYNVRMMPLSRFVSPHRYVLATVCALMCLSANGVSAIAADAPRGKAPSALSDIAKVSASRDVSCDHPPCRWIAVPRMDKDVPQRSADAHFRPETSAEEDRGRLTEEPYGALSTQQLHRRFLPIMMNLANQPPDDFDIRTPNENPLMATNIWQAMISHTLAARGVITRSPIEGQWALNFVRNPNAWPPSECQDPSKGDVDYFYIDWMEVADWLNRSDITPYRGLIGDYTVVDTYVQLYITTTQPLVLQYGFRGHYSQTHIITNNFVNPIVVAVRGFKRYLDVSNWRIRPVTECSHATYTMRAVWKEINIALP